jgi:hypothetical protein
VIANQTFGDDFGDLGDYLRRGRGRVDPPQRVGWVEFRNLPTRRMDIAERIMAGTASLSYTRKPVFHLSISFAPGDAVDEALMKRVMARTLADLGLGEHQAVIVAHIDTDDPHVHAMVNRVHPDTCVAWKGSWSRLRAEASLRRQELDEGLRVVPGWLARVPGHPELRPRPRLARGDEEFLREVRQRAEPVLEHAQSWADVEAGLAEFGLSVRVNGRGMSVTDGRRLVKASEVARQFSRGNLEKRLGRYSDYRARVAVASATIVRDSRGVSPAPVGIEGKAQAETRAAADAQPRFSLYEDGEVVGVWDSQGPQIFFAETRERAEAEMRRAEWLVARYPNIRAVRCLRDMDGECRDARGLPRLPEEKGRPPRTMQPVAVAETTIQPAAPEEEHSAPAPAPAPEVMRGNASFLDEVRSQARPALRLSESWAELEHGLAEVGLFLRVKGGGFVVTDGEQEVKASEVGREFSRRHLEKRLGGYPEHPVPVAEADVMSETPAPAVQPELPTEHVELAQPQAPEAALGEAEELIAPRFSLYEDGDTFGVYDSAGLAVFFADTRERALAEVERANEIVAVYPKAISIGFLREMDGAWRDAHGLPRLPEPEGHKSSVHWPISTPAETGVVPGSAPDHEIASPTPTVERGAEPIRALEPPSSAEPIREEVVAPPHPPMPEERGTPDQSGHEQGRDAVREAPAESRLDVWDEPRQSSIPIVDRLRDDPAVDEAVRAFTELEDARAAAELTRALRKERTRAEAVLTILAQQDDTLDRTQQDFHAAAERVYGDPAAAIAQWDALVLEHSGNLEAAAAQVRTKPEILGPLLTDSPASVRESIAEMFGSPGTRSAKEAVPQMLRRAALYTPARREAAKPVEWETPDGEKIVGRTEVRLRANAVVAERTVQIKALEASLADFGGISGAEIKVRLAFDWLSPAQRSQAERKIAAGAVASGTTETAAAVNLAEVLGRTHDAAKLAWGLGEGPGGL